MSSYRQILYHLIIRTKDNQKTLVLEHSNELYAYLGGIIRNKGCFPYEINGMHEHIHILSDLHPSIALSDLLRDLKTASSRWLKQNRNFPYFIGWSDGYGAFTYSFSELEIKKRYVRNQREHHAKFNFLEEYRALLKEHNVIIDEKYFP